MGVPVPTEKEECKVFVAYLRVKGHKFTAIQNETGRGKNARMMGVRNKQMGLSAGFPDYFVIVGDNVAFIEMKRQKGGRLSDSQRDWLQALDGAGQNTFVAKGAQEAINYIQTLEE